MYDDGVLWCDQCGQPIRVVHQGELIPHNAEHYCSRCAPLVSEPILSQIMQFIRFLFGGG